MADEGSSEDEDYDPTRQDEEDLVEKPAKRSRHRFIDDTAEVEDEEVNRLLGRMRGGAGAMKENG